MILQLFKKKELDFERTYASPVEQVWQQLDKLGDLLSRRSAEGN